MPVHSAPLLCLWPWCKISSRWNPDEHCGRVIFNFWTKESGPGEHASVHAIPARSRCMRCGTYSGCSLPRPAGPHDEALFVASGGQLRFMVHSHLQFFACGTARTNIWSSDGMEILTHISAHARRSFHQVPSKSTPPTIQPAVPVARTKTFLWSLTIRVLLSSKKGASILAPVDIPRGPAKVVPPVVLSRTPLGRMPLAPLRSPALFIATPLVVSRPILHAVVRGWPALHQLSHGVAVSCSSPPISSRLWASPLFVARTVPSYGSWVAAISSLGAAHDALVRQTSNPHLEA